MQDSVNKALEKAVPGTVQQALATALKPITRQLERFAKRHGFKTSEPDRDDSTTDPKPKSWPHSTALSTLSSAETDKSKRPDPDTDTDTTSTSPDEAPPKKKSKKSKNIEPDLSQSINTPFTFNPADIVHPRSSGWILAPEVAAYLHNNIRRSSDKEVRNRLRSECPRPDIPDKVADTPDIDASLLTFLKKFAKNPKKGIDRACRGCQDKLLDVVGPLAKILGMALDGQESGSAIDPHVPAGWTQSYLSTRERELRHFYRTAQIAPYAYGL